MVFRSHRKTISLLFQGEKHHDAEAKQVKLDGVDKAHKLTIDNLMIENLGDI